jgi:uncharacterized repeat protein (TIGR03843 family)
MRFWSGRATGRWNWGRSISRSAASGRCGTFPQGTLCLRERAAFVVSEALGWHIVPPTVLRDAQHGLGTVQLFIDHDPARHYFTIEGDETLRPQLQKIALLDILINNADRKAGHVLIQESEERPTSTS